MIAMYAADFSLVGFTSRAGAVDGARRFLRVDLADIPHHWLPVDQARHMLAVRRMQMGIAR